ncbi:MAG: DUF4337 domain-containing protein [Planctomycetota bacterium]
MSEPAKENQPSAMEVWIIRTTAILAVLAALSSGRWGASNLRAILEQGKVNDSWSYYQAKSIKQTIAQNSADLAESLHGDTALVASFRAEAKRYSSEKKERSEEAEYYQEQRNHHVEQSLWFEFSFACIQLGVVICTIAAATRSKKLWFSSITFGAIGLVFFLNGFFLWKKIGENALSKSFIKSMDAGAK